MTKKYAPSVAHLRIMRSTPSSKQAAYEFGYKAFVDGVRTREQFDKISTHEYLASESWSFVRGWEAAQKDFHDGKIMVDS